MKKVTEKKIMRLEKLIYCLFIEESQLRTEKEIKKTSNVKLILKEEKSLQHPVFPGGHPSKY